MQLLILYSENISLVVKTFSKVVQFLPFFLATYCLNSFIFEILGLLNPKRGTSDHFTMTKYNICLYFGPQSCLNQIKSPFYA